MQFWYNIVNGLNWLGNKIAAMFMELLSWLLEALFYVLSLLPLPDWFTNPGDIAAMVPADLWYFIHLFKIPYGISVAVSALVIRFIIRRLPFIG